MLNSTRDLTLALHRLRRQGNEHLFKDIRRKIATNHASEKEVLGRSKNDFDRTAVDKLFNDIHDLRFDCCYNRKFLCLTFSKDRSIGNWKQCSWKKKKKIRGFIRKWLKAKYDKR